MATGVNILYTPNQDRRKFGDFTLCFQNLNGEEVTRVINFDFQQLWEFARDTESNAFDMLIMALIVYNTDRVLNRYMYSEDGWRRSIRIANIPVRNKQQMDNAKRQLDDAISFLTGDDWDINFMEAPDFGFNGVPRRTYIPQEFKKVALFSGGLDSLIGFVDNASALAEDEKILLVSHMDLGKEANDQDDILGECEHYGFFNGKYERIRMKAGLKKIRRTQESFSYESTFRSRSLLFFAAGIYLAHHIDSNMELIVPENGTISQNIPLDEGRRSACSTRTTHPTFMRKFQEALSMVGIANRLVNPYRLKSKADMMSDCCEDPTKKAILEKLYPQSCSCAKRGHNRFWDKNGGQIAANHISHCGMCLPCLYRRVALHAVDWDKEQYLGTDVLHGTDYDLNNRSQKRTWDFNALLNFISRRMNEDTIRTELIANGIRDKRELDEYTELAMHSYEQVKEWIAAKAPSEIKHRIGV